MMKRKKPKKTDPSRSRKPSGAGAARKTPARTGSFPLSVLAREIGGKLVGSGAVKISGIGSLPEAGPGMISFAASGKYYPLISASRASAFLVGKKVEGLKKPQVIVPDPMLAAARVIELFYPEREEPAGVSPHAWVAPGARLGKGIAVYPFVYIGEGAEIGAGTVIYPHCYIGPGVSIGRECRLFSRVSVREGTKIGNRVRIHDGVVIGSDGFGYEWDGSRHRKIPQVGGVEIEDDVEIGANATIDRATLENTVIRRGTKIDNHVQVAHNVRIGSHAAIAAQVGIAGSSRIGDHTLIGGQAGIDDHVQIGNRVMIAGRSGVAKDLPDGAKVGGVPTVPFLTWLRISNLLPQLPEMKQDLERVKRRLAEAGKGRRAEPGKKGES